MNELIEEEEVVQTLPSTPATPSLPRRMKISDDQVSLLIHLVHGSTNSKKFLAREFHAHHLKKHHQDENFAELMLASIDLKITEIAFYRSCTEEGPMFGKLCWNVKPEVMKQYNVVEVKLPNEWEYILTKPVNVKSRAKKSLLVDVEETNEESGKKEAKIRKVEKVVAVSFNICLVNEINSLQFKCVLILQVPKPVTPAASDKKEAAPKKRVQLLMSVARGQQISDVKKNALISQFLSKKTEQKLEKNDQHNESKEDVKNGANLVSTSMLVDDIVVID